MTAYTLLLLSFVAYFAKSAPIDEQVVSLPDYGPPPTKQYSGFLDASAAEKGTHLHYWFSESSKSPTTDPVVLWLNGGPGSSSILGFLQEVGPLLINATGGLFENPYAWTTQANVVVLESPAGVGYSYCAKALQGQGCSNTDKSTAAAARAAMVNFFEKFPELSKNEFYITGESYAGVYVPTLVQEILDNAPEINMQGLLVGDPCTDNDSQQESMDMLWYSHKHGFVPDAEFDFLYNNCSARHPSFLTNGNWRAENGLLKSVNPSQNLHQSKACITANRKFLMSSSNGFSQDWPHAWINDLTLYGPSALVGDNVPGSLNYMQAQYMMRPDVREALHVTATPYDHWPGPQENWSYKSEYAACNGNAPKGTPSMIDIYRSIAPRLSGTYVFNGDTDPCVSYEGTRTAIERVAFPVVEGGEYRPWFYNATKASLAVLQEKPVLFGPDLSLQDVGPQFGGHIVNYAHNLSFLTIHGSGHMVPQFRPQAALHMLTKALNKSPFSPLVSDLSRFSDQEYETYLAKWTEGAKGYA